MTATVTARPPPGFTGAAVLAVLAIALSIAVALQLAPSPAPHGIMRTVPLSEWFPRSPSGWVSEDRPLGETEAISKAVKNILHYDEAFFRTYRKNGRSFSLYVAYWRAGRMPARDVAFHIPDQCWVGVGWKRTAVDYHYQRSFEGRLLAPAQYREFDAPFDHEYVLYWHVLDGRTITYSLDAPPTQWMTLKSLWHHGLAEKGEQYFIRLSSPVPPAELWDDDGFQAVMELIAPLGPGATSEGVLGRRISSLPRSRSHPRSSQNYSVNSFGINRVNSWLSGNAVAARRRPCLSISRAYGIPPMPRLSPNFRCGPSKYWGHGMPRSATNLVSLARS